MSRLTSRRCAVAVVALAASAVVAGCGGPASNGESAKAARQIIADAQAATGKARSVRVAGKGQVNGLAVQVDVADGQGHGGGTITIGGSTVQMVLAGQDFYLKTTPAVIQQLTGNATTATQDANKWLQTSSSNSSVASLLPLLDISKLATGSFTFSGIPTKQATTAFEGQRAVPVVDSQGGDTVYVAATGTPYLLGIKGAASNGGSTLSFTGYDRTPIPAAPAGAVKLTPPAG